MFVLLALLSAFCATVPMLTFLAAVWFFDRHEREPLWLFLLTFAWGAIGGVIFAMIGSTALQVPLTFALGASLADQYSAVLIAPLVEEPTKAAILFAIMFSRHFDNATDGFVYGAAAGLGFGMTENFLYFLTVAASGDVWGWMFTVVIRTFFSAVMHACATSCVGAMLGFARFRGIGWKIVAVPIGFGVAMGIHALWNGMLTAGELFAQDWMSWANFAMFIGEFAIIIVVFQLALWDERATIRRELADEVKEGLLPLAHAKAIGSYFRRSRPGWVPKGIPQRHYVRAVTTLALRKHQSRNCSKRSYAFYADEVVRLRREVSSLLKLAHPAAGPG